MAPRHAARGLARLTALAILLFGTQLVAQTRADDVASVTGRVADETGGVLPGAIVTLRDPEASGERSAATDSNGRFTIQPVPPGTYVLSVSMSGFEALTLESVVVTAGARTSLDLRLEVSGLEDTVVVRGTARNYADAVAAKRSDDRVVDAFSADEIGRLPDKNIGETLNRIPGVSMLLEKGEGRFIQIRGISPRLNNITINGMNMGNGETESGGRLVPLDVIGGELLSGVQVIKTPTPDMDGQGIGGTLNVTTKQPFDFAQSFTALVSTRGGFESIESIAPADTKETPYAWDATLAGKLARGKVGWLAGSSFSNRRTPLLGVYQDDWRPVSLGGQSVTYPTSVKNNVTVTARERLNLTGTVEVRPRPDTKLFVRSFFARWNELQLRNRFDEGLSDRLIAIESTTAGTVSADRVQVNLRSEPTLKELFSVAVGGSQRMGLWTLDVTGQRNDNRVDEPNDSWEFQSGTTTFGPDTFRVQDDGTVVITSPGRDRQDASFQNFRRVRFFKQLTNESSYIGAADLRREFVMNESPAFLKVGAKLTSINRSTEVSQPSYNVGSQVWTAAQVPSASAGGFMNPIPLRSMPNLWLDIDDLTAFYAANGNDPRYFQYDAATSFLNEYQSDFSLRERVAAVYAMSKVGLGRLALVGGVRIESTDVDSTANTIVTQAGQRVARPIDGNGAYTNVLPSIVGTFGIRSDLLARAAFTTAVGRPEFDALAPRSQLGIEENPALGTVGTLTIGNPDLQARRSNNLDLSLEWYFDEGALASVAFFNKDISNEIIPAPTERRTDYVFEGQRFARFDINTTVNAENAFVRGVELTLAHRLRFLPAPLDGLGFGGSFTLLDSGVDVERDGETLTLPLLEQADRSTSLTLYYQKGRWDVSGTYKYNANFWTDYGTSRSLDLDQGSFGRFDFRMQFDISPDIKFNFSGINLNDEPTSEFQGGNRRWNTEYEFTGRTFFFGLSARIAR